MADKRMSVSEASRRLGVGIDQVRKLIYSGKLEAHKVPWRNQWQWLITMESLNRYKAQRRRDGH